MPEIIISDDILAPSDVIKIHFEGKNPFSVVPGMISIIKYEMKLSGKDMRETDIRWDVSSDPREFYGVWLGKRTNDRWTATYVRVIAQGAQSSVEKIGWIDIWLKGYIETKYEYSNFIQKSFWWIYNYMFYWKQRRSYLERAKDDLFKIRDRLMTQLGIIKEY
ncbi:MAG: hypothetical protein QXD48_03595 [Candidatus Aenigmatarchaeota archaeon]